jgi:HK97 family phage major capsid protein
MTTGSPSTVSDFVKLSQAAIIAGDLDAAETYKNQAFALKGLDELTPKVDASKRLDMGDGSQDSATQEANANTAAMKAWYTKSTGGTDIDGDIETVLNDMYGNYRRARWAKAADFTRFLRSGTYDPALKSLVVYTPEQIMMELAAGLTVSDIKAAQKATQLESQDTSGGYLVPEDFRDSVVTRLQGMTQMRAVAETITTASDRVTMPVSDGGTDRYTGSVRVFKVDESPTSTQAATNALFSQTTIPVYTLMAHVAVSKNLIDDSRGASAILPYLNNQFSTAYAVYEDEQFIVGNGIAGPQGILRDNTTGGPYTFSYGSIATVNSGSATALQADSIRNLPYSIASQYRQPGAKWFMSRGTVRVIKTLKAGDGTYLWSGRSDVPQLAQGQPQSLEGYAIGETEVLASPTTNSGSAYTANVYPILFVTKGSYLIVDKAGGMDVQRYDDSTTAVANSIVLVMRRRVGGQVILPWGIGSMKVSA